MILRPVLACIKQVGFSYVSTLFHHGKPAFSHRLVSLTSLPVLSTPPHYSLFFFFFIFWFIIFTIKSPVQRFFIVEHVSQYWRSFGYCRLRRQGYFYQTIPECIRKQVPSLILQYFSRNEFNGYASLNALRHGYILEFESSQIS